MTAIAKLPRTLPFFAALLLLAGVLPGAAAAHEKSVKAPASEQAAPAGMMGGQMMNMPGTRNMRMPRMDSTRGRELFINKGCVTCHSINGVGGHDATALDAHTMTEMMNPFDFAAKMWLMAPAMIAAQEDALGEQILFSGDELADIIAFVHDDREQHHLSDANIPPRIREMMNHQHGAPGGGTVEHAEEIGHDHDGTMGADHHGGAVVPPAH